MEVKDNLQVFNLMDTNGRRTDVVNALNIYLCILQELQELFPSDFWSTYKSTLSLTQIRFYIKALEYSSDVFKTHSNYDLIKDKIDSILNESADLRSDSDFLKSLDANVEARSRHYTSTLVTLGLANIDRSISPAGKAFLNKHVDRDKIEELLPINDVNLIILRQLLKLRVYSKEKDKFYSPFLKAIQLFLYRDEMSTEDFINEVQEGSPYEFSCEIADEFKVEKLIEKEDFCKVITNGKSKDSLELYYNFYVDFYNFCANQNESNYKSFIKYFDEGNSSDRDKTRTESAAIKKAFFKGTNPFQFFGKPSCRLDYTTFKKRNASSKFLNTTDNINKLFYENYVYSKKVDQVTEYGDTTKRILSATGLINLSKSPDLYAKEVFNALFNEDFLNENIIHSCNPSDYNNYEGVNDSFFFKNTSILEILKKKDDEANILANLCGEKSADELRTSFKSDNEIKLRAHIKEKYNINEVIKILELFNDRDSHNKEIKAICAGNVSAPTIYEYINAIAWFHLSDGDTSDNYGNYKYDLYNSFNLSLDGNFEPILHAGGGKGDVVFNYKKSNDVVMLEVTLMDLNSQKRGEWEPVLRHSINLKVENDPLRKEVITFFIAPKFDTNTVNIWRAVASIPLESSESDSSTNKVIIMPIDNSKLITLLKKKQKNKDVDKELLSSVRNSFNSLPTDFDVEWIDKIYSKIS